MIGDDVSSPLLIATTPRSGSWLLSDHLARTGKIATANEYFHVNYVAALSREMGLATSGITEQYLAAIVERATNERVMFSAKLHWLQINQLVDALRVIHPELAARNTPAPQLIEASLPRARYLFLTRRDKARQAVSMFRAARTDRWWELATEGASAEAGSTVARDEPHVPPDHLTIRWFEEELTEQDAEWLRYFRFFGIDPFVVVYEELVAEPRAIIRALLDWLGLEDTEAPAGDSRLRRQAGAETERTLLEYQQIRDSLPPRPPGWQWSFKRGSFGPPVTTPRSKGARTDDGPTPPIAKLSPL